MSDVRTRSRFAAVGASIALVAAGVAGAPAAFAAPALTVEPTAPAAGTAFRVVASGLDAAKQYRLSLTNPTLGDNTDRAESNSCSSAASPTGTTLTCTLTETSVGPYQARLFDAANSLVVASNVTVNTPVAVTPANAPRIVDNAGTANDAIIFTNTPGIAWSYESTSATGSVTFAANAAAGATQDVNFDQSRNGAVDVTVRATATSGFAFPEGAPTFTFRLTGADPVPAVLTVPTASAPKAVDEVGLTKDQATFTKVDGVDWYVVTNSAGAESKVEMGTATSVTIPVTPLGEKHEVTVYARAQADRAFSNGRLAEVFTLTYTDAKAPVPSTRVQGRDRFATAVEISKRYFTTSDVVYVANGYRQADALSAGPAAAKENAPLLLTFEGSVRDDVAAEIARLKPKTIKLVGGESVLSEAVAQRLGQIATVQRLSGANREATAAAVARQSIFNGATTVYVANGSDATWPDAISGGSGAADEGGPLLLSRRGELSDATVEVLAGVKATNVRLVGGTDVVNSSVITQVKTLQPNATVTRLEGPNRYGTNADVVNKVTGLPATSKTAFVATGLNWPDALAGVPAAKRANAPLALSTASCYPRPVAAALTKLPLESVVLLGGSNVLGNHALTTTCTF
ncbi:MAG: cell wall-binding repeat-containing protein [Dermatophilus congolensis]|nr:cell wall-binding repeat-containing protein [Dermatophilus congolensis]